MRISTCRMLPSTIFSFVLFWTFSHVLAVTTLLVCLYKSSEISEKEKTPREHDERDNWFKQPAGLDFGLFRAFLIPHFLFSSFRNLLGFLNLFSCFFFVSGELQNTPRVERSLISKGDSASRVTAKSQNSWSRYEGVLGVSYSCKFMYQQNIAANARFLCFKKEPGSRYFGWSSS